MLLHLASHQHLSVVHAVGSHFSELAGVDPQLPRALIRVVMMSCAHPRRGDDDRQNEANQRVYREKVEAAIAAEKRWLDGAEAEPAWPELPAWQTRPRRGFRIGEWTEEIDEEFDEEVPDHYIDEHALGALASHLIRLTVGELPPWIIALSAHLMQWTEDANGLDGEHDGDRDDRPHTWNSDFFDFLGILSVALPHEKVVAMFLKPITRFSDEAFHDCMAEFLRGFDRATQATDTKNPENPAAVRELLADRIRKGWNFRRLGREKGWTSETHAGDALSAMFYQPAAIVSHGRPSVPEDWIGLDATMPTLTNLVTQASSSGYIATLFLNLVESSHRAALLPFVAQAAAAWRAAYGVDTHFWAERDVGGRVCGWLERTFTADPASADVLPGVAEDLLKPLDILVQSGVAQAHEMEERITGMIPNRKTG